MGTKYLEMYIMLVYRLILECRVIKPIELCMVYPIVLILCVLLLLFLCFRFFSCFSFFLRFCRYIFCKPSRDLTRPLGGTKWFKWLVAYAKYNRDSYESELGL